MGLAAVDLVAVASLLVQSASATTDVMTEIVGAKALTSKDIENLEFIVSNATAVGLSFVHSSNDIRNLHETLLDMEKADFGIIAKIETSGAFNSLAKILLGGLDLPNFGILIARGDLAVEMGFENLPAIQEDILCMCEAAHISHTYMH